MSNLRFEGEVDGISDRQLDFIRSILEDRGFNNERVLVFAVGKADDNYVSVVKRFVVDKGGETFKMIAKLAPTSEILRAKSPTKVLFRNEHIMYTRVFPKFSELEKEAGVLESDKLKYPIYYGSLCEEPNEIIVLEDLQLSNFIMLDKHKSLTDETVKLILKNFAKLHSLSFVLNNQEPETYEAIKTDLVNYWIKMTEVKELKAFLVQLEDEVITILDNDKHKMKIKGLVTEISNFAIENNKITRNSKYAVIQHGDSWINNILFRLEGNEAIDCCMLDYQIANHTSPVADIEFMIFICTDYETRSKHYHEWINYYHTQLGKCLSNFGLDLNFIYPKDKFVEDLKVFGKFSLGLSIMFASILMRESDDAANMKAAMQSEDDDVDAMLSASKLSNMSASSIKRMKAKVIGIITSYFALGYQ